MSLAVSLCVIRIETNDETLQGPSLEPDTACRAMASDQWQLSAPKSRISRGRRTMKDITVETYPHGADGKGPTGLLSGDEATALPQPDTEAAKPRGSGGQDGAAVELPATEQINFISGNPFVEVTKGILHLFKEDQLTHVNHAAERSQTVCILAVPATMTCHDLLTYTAACHGDIQHLRIIRDGSPNQYMALLTFRTQQSASEFYTTFNGAPYNSLEPDCICHLVFVSRVEIAREGEAGCLPPPGHTELPTCPVCLERMDESVDGILTILCNHAFHGSCLAKWGDTSCPVCRYVQTPELVEDNRCLECHSCDSLWICLICGHVGCGRYVQGHASEHYLATQHCYSMQLGTNRVWDYVGDNFVHRLLQNKGDGKLVEGSAPAKHDDEKLDSVQLEFTYLLTSQLDSQRLYYEEKICRIESSSLAEIAQLKERLNESQVENQRLQKKLEVLAREKITSDKKLQHVSNRLATALSELQDERQMSKAIQLNQSTWQHKFTALEADFSKFKTDKEKEMVDLKEQLRDVMFFLEGQKQCSESADRAEIAEGRITVGEPAADGKTRRRKHR